MGSKFIKKAFYYSPFKEIKDSKALYGIKCYIYQHFYEHLDLSLEHKMFNNILEGYSGEVLGFVSKSGEAPNMEVAAVKIQKDFQKFRTWVESYYKPDGKLPPNPDQDEQQYNIDRLQGDREKNNTKENIPLHKT